MNVNFVSSHSAMWACRIVAENKKGKYMVSARGMILISGLHDTEKA